jgi:hypothetical protein
MNRCSCKFSCFHTFLEHDSDSQQDFPNPNTAASRLLQFCINTLKNPDFYTPIPVKIEVKYKPNSLATFTFLLDPRNTMRFTESPKAVKKQPIENARPFSGAFQSK